MTSPASPTVFAAILAGGKGERMAGYPKLKQFLPLGDTMVIEHSIHTFAQHPWVNTLLIVVPQSELAMYEKELSQKSYGKPLHIIAGGTTRQESSFQAVEWIRHQTQGNPLVALHDAARPFLTAKDLDACLKSAREFGAAELAIPVSDTIASATGQTLNTVLDRKTLWAIQTPQVFRLELIHRAHHEARNNNLLHASDDASLVHALGHRVMLVPGKPGNFKITNPIDYELAQMMVQRNNP